MKVYSISSPISLARKEKSRFLYFIDRHQKRERTGLPTGRMTSPPEDLDETPPHCRVVAGLSYKSLPLSSCSPSTHSRSLCTHLDQAINNSLWPLFSDFLPLSLSRSFHMASICFPAFMAFLLITRHSRGRFKTGFELSPVY